MLDMRKIHLATYNIQSFPTKAAAKKAALARGYRAGDVLKAYNRFCVFYVIGQSTPGDIDLAACSFGTVRLFFNSVGQLDLVPETI